MRTLCSACAERIDAEARFKNKVIGVGIVVFVGFVIFANSGSDRRIASAVDRPVVLEEPSVKRAKQVAGTFSSGSAALPASQGQPSAIISSAEAAVVAPATAGFPQLAAAVHLPAWKSSAAVRWKHKTDQGTRWSLRQLRGSLMAILIDLGDDHVATVIVTPEFQRLGSRDMNGRIEYVKSEIIKVSASSATYSFARSGVVSPYP